MNELKREITLFGIWKSIVEYRLELIVFSIFFFYLLILRYLIPFFQLDNLTNVMDWHMYVAMSRDIFSIFRREIVPPFCYRPFIPFIAGVLPFDLQTSYSIITFFSVFGTGILLYFTLRLKFNKILSATGLFLFVFLSLIPGAILPFFYYAFYGVYFYEIYNVDAPAMFFIMACFYCIFSSKKKGYIAFLILGILTKEFVIVTIPTFLIYECVLFKGNKKQKEFFLNLAREILILIPALLVFFVIRVIVIPLPTSETIWHALYQGTDYGSFEMVMEFLNFRITEIFNNSAFLPLTLGLWSVAIIIHLLTDKNKHFKRWIGIHATFCLITCVQLALGYNTALFKWIIVVWSPIVVSLCLLNESKTIRLWVLVNGVFLLSVYGQLILGYAVEKYIQYGFYPVIFLAISGLNNVFFTSPLTQLKMKNTPLITNEIPKKDINVFKKFLKNIRGINYYKKSKIKIKKLNSD